MSAPAFRFVSSKTANRLVAGVPAAARLARSYAEALPGEPLVLAVGDGGTLTTATMADIGRLAPGLRVHMAHVDPDKALPGEALPDASAIAAYRNDGVPVPLNAANPFEALQSAGRDILRSTAKPSDGLVSRRLNRPVSQAVSALLLRFLWIRPGHATALTALTAIAMFVCLLTGTTRGLIGGALLFQVASVVDGIDGEIARATFRTSARGASLDSITDGLTNCGFFLGCGINYLMQSSTEDALVSFATAAMMAFGLLHLGRYALRRDGYIHFEGIKHAHLAGGKVHQSWLKDVSSRDSYCVFLLGMTLMGALAAALKIFMIAIIAWLIVVFNGTYCNRVDISDVRLRP